MIADSEVAVICTSIECCDQGDESLERLLIRGPCKAMLDQAWHQLHGRQSCTFGGEEGQKEGDEGEG